MAAADFQSRGIARQQREGDAEVLLVAQQVLGVVHAEGQPDQRRHRRQGDVALVEGEAHAQHVGAVPFALADDAVVGDRGRIGTGIGTGQREARDLAAIGKARQVVVLLLLRAVMHQQLARPEGVGHRDGGHQRRRHAGDLLQHRRMGQRGKPEPAVFLRDDQAEELLLLEELPHLRRQVRQFVGDLPVVDHGAELLDRPIQIGLLLHRQARYRLRQQRRPVRLAAEELALEADRAGVERHLLGFRQRGHHLLEQGEQGCAQLAAPEIDPVEGNGEQGEQQQGDGDGECGRTREPAGADDRDGRGDGPGQQAEAEPGGSEGDGQRGEERHECGHGRTPAAAARGVRATIR